MEKRQSTSPSPTFGYNNQFGLYENHVPNAPHHRKTGLYVRLLSERAFTSDRGVVRREVPDTPRRLFAIIAAFGRKPG